MPFDPTKSFEVVEEPPASTFDHKKPFSVIPPSGFDPSKPYEVVGETASLRPTTPPPGQQTQPVAPVEGFAGVPQAFPAAEQRQVDLTAQAAARQPPLPSLGQVDITAAARQEPESTEAEIQPIGKPGTLLYGASEVAASVLNRPEYLAAMLNPATAAAVGLRYAPGVAKQFIEDLGKASQGDDQALGRAAMIGIPALVGAVRGGRSITQRMAAQTALERARSASAASSIDALARLELTPPTMLKRSEAELSKIPGERTTDASKVSKTTEVHGDVRPLPVQGEGEVPVKESGAGVQPQAERGLPEARPDDTGAEAAAAAVQRDIEIKPAPAAPEQAPPTEAPTTAAVSAAKEGVGETAPSPSAISEATTPPKISQPPVEKRWFNASHQEQQQLVNRPVTSVDSLGTWVTSSAENAKTLYGPNVYQVEVPPNLRLLEFDGSDPSQIDFNRVIGANAQLAREAGFTKEAKILDATLPDTRRYSALNRKANLEGLRGVEFEEFKRLKAAENASRTLLRSGEYMQRFKAFLQQQGYDGILWKNSRIDTRPSDPAHDVAVIFHKEPLKTKTTKAADVGGASEARTPVESLPKPLGGTEVKPVAEPTPTPPAQVEGGGASLNRSLEIERRWNLSPAEAAAFNTAIDRFQADPGKWTTAAEGIQKEALRVGAPTGVPLTRLGDLKLSAEIAETYARNAETPSKAAAKVQKEFKAVAREEGQRSAKEVKSDLVDKIQRAIDVAPLEADVKPRSSTAVHGATTVTPDQATTVTIEIPGDGTFTVRNTKEALEGLLKRAKRISTDVTPKASIPKGAIQSSEKALGKMEEAKAAELQKNIGINQEAARARLYDAINKGDQEGMVGRSQPQEDPETYPEGTLWREWRIRKATPEERTEHWKGYKSEIRWVGERRVVKFSKDKGRTENEWMFDDSGKTRADVIRGMEANMPKDAILQDEGAKAWRDLEGMTGSYAFLKEGKTEATPPTPGMSVGPGAASPVELAQPGTIVSNMFAAIDRDRAEMGKPPMAPGEPRTWDQDQQIATARMNRDPQWIPDLIKEVGAKPRPLLSWENAGMVMQKAFWKAEANNALRRIANAVDSRLGEAELLRAKADAARFEDNLAEMEAAVGRGGTGSEAGRTLQAQKMGLTDDLTLVEMRLEMRGKIGGRKLSEPESAAIDKLHKEYQAKIEALNKTATETERRRVEAETRATLAELARQSAEQKVPPPHIQKIVDKIRTGIRSEANAARERLKGKLFTIGDPEVLLDLAKIGADNILSIGEDFARWSVKMAEDIGEKVKPHLQQIWDASKKFLDDRVDTEAGVKKAPKATGPKKTATTAKEVIQRIATPQAKQERLTKLIKERIDKDKAKSITPLVQRLARAFVEGGVRGRDELIDAVHGVLQSLDANFTRRQTMDAISGYGDYRTLSKDEVSTELRTLKGQMQQIAKLEDMAAGQAPLRTGIERREVTPAESKLIKLVNEAKRKGGYETADPETQLRTALDEVKKRTQSQIDEYERRIREEDYSVRRLEPIKPDAELISKQAEVKRVRKKWEQMKRDKELANRKPWQRALDRFVRWERAFKLSSPVVFGKLSSAALTRFVTTATEEATGAGLGMLPGIRTLAKQAPREGGINVPAMAKGVTEALSKGMKDAWETAKRGMSSLDEVYGEKLIDRDWSNVFGQLHGMLKAPVKRAEFTLSLEKRIQFAIKNGEDVADPLVMTRLATEALNDGYRSIFMQRGFSSDTFNQMVTQMEKSKKYPISGEVSARLARFLLPVVRVPANIVSETATGIVGTPVASMRTMFHVVNGTLGKLDPVVADSIMRQFKKGSIGLGLIAIGYFNPDSIGGYDWREKRQRGAVKTGGFQVAGVDVPRWATHAPWFELMQFGATIRHVKDQHVQGVPKGVGEGMWAAGLGLIEETPFVGQMLRVDKLFESQAERTYYLGELAKGTLVPQAVAKAAQLTDTRFGQPIQRKPKTVWQGVETGIPGLRQNVPEKPPK